MSATLSLHGNHDRLSCINRPLDSRQLRAFCVLARTGSFTQTARQLHLTQSGVSHAMKALEGDVGCRLLDRLGKKVVLTQVGEHLLYYATGILREMEGARESIAQLGKWGRGRLPGSFCEEAGLIEATKPACLRTKTKERHITELVT